MLSGEELDVQIAVERLGDAEQRVDPRRPASPLEPCDRRLSGADQLGQLALGQSSGLPPLGDLVGHRSEEPTPVGRANPFLQALES